MPLPPPRTEALASAFDGLDPSGPPRARAVRPARAGLRGRPGTLVVLDASFNPPTRAHAGVLERSLARVGAGEGLLLLSRANVDKQLSGAGLGERLLMMTLLAESDDRIAVGAGSHARFVDKARALERLYPPGTRLHFAVGYDTLVRLFDPGYYQDMEGELDAFFSRASVVAANRDGHGLDEAEALLETPARRRYRDRIRFIELPPDLARISSTSVREGVASGRPVDHLLPPGIARCIGELGLYRSA